MSPSDKNVTIVATAVVENINSLMTHVQHLCHELKLARVVKAVQTVTSIKKDERYDDKIPSDYLYYQVTLETSPGQAMFEITTSIHTKSGNVSTDLNESVSRINRYNIDPACVAGTHPELLYYCVCF